MAKTAVLAYTGCVNNRSPSDPWNDCSSVRGQVEQRIERRRDGRRIDCGKPMVAASCVPWNWPTKLAGATDSLRALSDLHPRLRATRSPSPQGRTSRPWRPGPILLRSGRFAHGVCRGRRVAVFLDERRPAAGDLLLDVGRHLVAVRLVTGVVGDVFIEGGLRVVEAA
jgi:hypothetical protein